MAAHVKTDKELLADALDQIRIKNKHISAFEREIRRRIEHNESAEKVRTEIFNLREQSPEPPDWLDREPHKSTSGIPLVCLNDWHGGEMVEKDQVANLNEFNHAILRKRVRILHDTVVDLCFNHMTNPNYPGLVAAILGDMITGIIHDELMATNEGPVTHSVQLVKNLIIGLLLNWKRRFKNIAVIAVPGNHGRDTPKPRLKNYVYESWEWLIFCAVEEFFRDDPDVQVYVPNEVDAHFTIFGHRFLATHGDNLGVKGGDGIIGALGPIARGALKVGAQQAQAGRDFDTLVIGHYHIYVPRGDATKVLVSPALIGHNEYAHLRLRVRASRPAQALSFIHHRHGFTAQWPMYLDKKIQADKQSPWFVWSGQRTNRDLDLG
jgi:predicted phosphodiesterase